METIILTIKEHKGDCRDAMHYVFTFPKKQALVNIIKKIPGSTWSQSKRQWHFNLERQIVKLLKEALEGHAMLDTSLLSKQLKEKKQKLNGEKSPNFQDTNSKEEKKESAYRLDVTAKLATRQKKPDKMERQ